MTTRTFSQTPPDKANELFEKLLATSDNAAKTRERLLSDLKEELDLLANLQEQYLFPVLSKHRMQDLVQEAIQDNQETSALLAELDGMPKNNGEFLSKVAELKKVFQQHIRDDKKELLPAVLKVLSDEEAEAVAEQVQDEMASVDEAKRVETRRAREQVDIVHQVAENLNDTVQTGAEGAQTAVRTMQEAVQTGLSTASELARLTTDQAMQFFNPGKRDAQSLGDETSRNLQAVAQAGTVLARGVQDVSREWFELSQKRLQMNLDGLSSLARCRSVPDFVAVQTSLIRDNLEQTLDNSRLMAELTQQLADKASRTVTVQAEKSPQRVSPAA
jgi:hemerythrin-like domain-containing protein